MSDPSLLDHNARAWDKQAQTESPWSLPVSSEQVEQARRGQWQVHLLPSPVPADWLGDVQGKSVLCLASAGGHLLSSFFNPAVFIADRDPSYAQQGLIRPKFTVPYSDLSSLDAEARQAKQARMEPLIFGHSLAQQIGGQLEAGLYLVDYIEEMHPAPRFEIEKYLPSFIATRSRKPV